MMNKKKEKEQNSDFVLLPIDIPMSASNEATTSEPDGSSLSTNPPQSLAAHPVPTLPPFLSKCYDMVDDKSTEKTVSWGAEGNSFVIWDPHNFSTTLLPKYFKHNNLSSFVRQLNTYGFHKVDPDRWEFANEKFLKGQKQLLKTITRKKNTQATNQPKPTLKNSLTTKTCIEVGKFGLEEEIERLKRDKNVLMQELVKLRQHQQGTDIQLHDVKDRLQVMEQHQKQMLSFLALAVQSPGILAKVIQQKSNTRWMTESNKKRRIPELDHGDANAHSEGQIVRYQPFTSDKWKPLLTSIPNVEVTAQQDPLSDTISTLHRDADNKLSAPELQVTTGEEFLLDIPHSYIDNFPFLENAENHNQYLDLSDINIDFDFDFDEPETVENLVNDVLSSDKTSAENSTPGSDETNKNS